MADRILVLENGEISEQGSHAELLAHRGRYAELFELQAAGYR
jgi:ATP-binding cassette subfamily B protein